MSFITPAHCIMLSNTPMGREQGKGRRGKGGRGEREKKEGKGGRNGY